MKKIRILMVTALVTCVGIAGLTITVQSRTEDRDFETSQVENSKDTFPTATETCLTQTSLIPSTTKEVTTTEEFTTKEVPTTVTTTKKKVTTTAATTKKVEKETTEKETSEETTSTKKTAQIYSASSFKTRGVIYWNDYRWTWYSQKVLPGGGLRIPGRHVDSNGYVCDENNYICLASSTLKKGTVVETPFGKQGKIYDSGCAVGTLDVYVNW